MGVRLDPQIIGIVSQGQGGGWYPREGCRQRWVFCCLTVQWSPWVLVPSYLLCRLVEQPTGNSQLCYCQLALASTFSIFTCCQFLISLRLRIRGNFLTVLHPNLVSSPIKGIVEIFNLTPPPGAFRWIFGSPVLGDHNTGIKICSSIVPVLWCITGTML